MTSKPDTGMSYHALLEEGRSHLRENVVITVEEFEDHLFDLFHKEWEEGAFDNVEGKRRKRWENLVDWVKARLTQQSVLHYLKIRDERYMVWMEGAGFLDNTSYYRTTDVHSMLRALVAKVNEHD